MVLGVTACAEKPETQAAYIQRSLQERLAKHQLIKKEKCQESIMEQASEIADSILLKEALQLDSLMDKLPVVPPKPEFIEPSPTGDSLAVEPFLKKD